MSTRVWVAAVAAVLGLTSFAHAQGRGGPGGQMRNNMSGAGAQGGGGGTCAGRGSQSQTQSLRTQGGTSNLQSMQATQYMQAMRSQQAMSGTATMNQLRTGTYQTSPYPAAQQQAAQQYIRAVGMHPANLRWLQQGSYR